MCENKLPGGLVFDCPARSLEDLSADEIQALYFQALEDGARNCFTPVVVYVDETLTEAVEDNFLEVGSPEAFRSAVLSEDFDNGPQRLQALYADLENIINPELLAISEADLQNTLAEFEAAKLPDAFPMGQSSGTPYLLYVPTEHPWEIFAWIPFCGWNSCPKVSDMIAICKNWQERFGAIPAMITYDTLSLYVPEPVKEQKTAIALAKEQAAFCDGIFEIASPVYYAVSNLNRHYWSFWWD